MINIFNPKNIYKIPIKGSVPQNVFTQKDRSFESPNTDSNINLLDLYQNRKIERNISQISVVSIDGEDTASVAHLNKKEPGDFDHETFEQVKKIIQELDIDGKRYNLNELKKIITNIKIEYGLRNINVNVPKTELINLFDDIVKNPSMFIPMWVHINDNFKIDMNKIKNKSEYLVKDLKQIIRDINKSLQEGKPPMSVSGNRTSLYNKIEEYINDL